MLNHKIVLPNSIINAKRFKGNYGRANQYWDLKTIKINIFKIKIGIYIKITIFAFLLMRQRQGTILVMLGYHVYSGTREKRRNKIAHIRSREIGWQEVIGMNNFAKEAAVNNSKIAR